ncbi:hypothetical protein V8C34DRAFT_291227 [Trichoderma compactum]
MRRSRKNTKLQGMTRSLENDRSVALIRQGVHMVQVCSLYTQCNKRVYFEKADLNDEASVGKAIEGSDVVFGMTNCQIPFPLQSHHESEQMINSPPLHQQNPPPSVSPAYTSPQTN